MAISGDLIKSIFKTGSLKEVSGAELNILKKQYPYFAHAYWFAALKGWNNADDGSVLKDVAPYTPYPSHFRQFVENSHNGINTKDRVEPSSVAVLPEEEKSSPDKADKAEVSPEEVKEQTAAIEPLFTQDYFAFTGTRLPDQIENDKKPTLEQLQSFTGWLRTMKKTIISSHDPDLGGEEIRDMEDPDPDISEYAAEKDIKNEEDVTTESMADVRVSRGEYDKAIAIYEKLSLSNPEKSSYFAQKIEALKNR